MLRIDRTVFILIIFFTLNGVAFAQQNAQFSQHVFNSLVLNPAYAGSRNLVAATALYRNQWVGIEGAPKTVTFTMDAPLSSERIGLGFQVGNDKVGVTNLTNFVLSGAYRIPVSKGSLSFGLQSSINNYYASFSNVNPDPSGSVPDQAFSSDVNKSLYNFGSGIYYNSERFYIGFSVLDFVSNRLNINTINSDDITARQRAHAYFTTGYVFPVGSDFDLKTSVIVKEVSGAPLQAHMNAAIWIKQMIAIGAGYKTGADISALMELRLTPQVRLGYAYDKSITALRSYNSGSHEFMLRYEFSFDRSKTLSPRYF